MRKLLYVICLILVSSSAFGQQITIGKKKGYYNDFSTNSNCVAVWNLESGALTTDSKGTNTLTDNNTVGTDTTNFKQGAASGDFEVDNSESLSITDANLDSGFPLKSGDTTKDISVCAWVRPESFNSEGSGRTIFSKFNAGGDKASILLTISTVSGVYKLKYHLAFNGGTEAEIIYHASNLSTGTWYHVTVTYQNSDKAYAIRVRDTDGATVGSDVTGTATLDANKLSVTDAPFYIGAFLNSGTPITFFDGNIDEVVVFKTVLTEAQSTAISKGVFR